MSLNISLLIMFFLASFSTFSSEGMSEFERGFMYGKESCVKEELVVCRVTFGYNYTVDGLGVVGGTGKKKAVGYGKSEAILNLLDECKAHKDGSKDCREAVLEGQSYCRNL